MNDNFNSKNSEHRNLAAKLSNSITDLNFYAYRFLCLYGFPAMPRTGLHDAISVIEASVRYRKPPPQSWPNELDLIIEQYTKILCATPDNANELFYETWRMLHNFDHIFKHERI